MRWIFIGIALGIGIMLAPYLVHGALDVLSLLFWLSAGGIYWLFSDRYHAMWLLVLLPPLVAFNIWADHENS